MADFDIAYGETEIREGGYVHDPVDKGGETHRGVSRRFNGDWKGWTIIDKIKKDHPTDFKDRINASEELEVLAKELYRERYWAPVRGDEIPDQHIANKVFDTAVNLGVGTSVKFLQLGLNLLNRNGTDYADVETDMKFGAATMASLKAFLKLEDDRPDYLLKILNVLQAHYYMEVMRKDPTQERFARGWLNRVDLR